MEVLTGWVRHRTTLFNSPAVDGTGLHIDNDIDLTNAAMDNVEISMRVSSDLKSSDVFYTDLNGFQVWDRLEQTEDQFLVENSTRM